MRLNDCHEKSTGTCEFTTLLYPTRNFQTSWTCTAADPVVHRSLPATRRQGSASSCNLLTDHDTVCISGALIIAQIKLLASRFVSQTSASKVSSVDAVWTPTVNALLALHDSRATISPLVIDGILAATLHACLQSSVAMHSAASYRLLLHFTLWAHSNIRPLAASSFHSLLLAVRAGLYDDTSSTGARAATRHADASIDAQLRTRVARTMPLAIPNSFSQLPRVSDAHPWSPVLDIGNDTPSSSRFAAAELIVNCMLLWGVRPDEHCIALLLDTATSDVQVCFELRNTFSDSSLFTS